MKFIRNIIAIILFISIISCGCTTREDSTAPAKTIKEPNTSSSNLKENAEDHPSPNKSEEQEERVEDLISTADSVDYKVNREWVSNSDKTQTFIKSLNDLIPDNLGETATFYDPDSIVIKYNLPTSELHMLSIQDRKVSVEVSSVEISKDGIIFLMPQGMSLGVVNDVETIIPEQ